MGIFDRIILSIYTFFLAFLSIGVILLALQLIPVDVVWTGLSRIYGQWEASLVGAVFLLVSVRLLLAGIRSRRGKSMVIHHTEMGDVQVSLRAVENLVEKTARHIHGVRGVNVDVTQGDHGLKVGIKAVVSLESNIPTVTAEMQAAVHKYIKNTVGVDLADVKIVVENISNEFKARHRVE